MFLLPLFKLRRPQINYESTKQANSRQCCTLGLPSSGKAAEYFPWPLRQIISRNNFITFLNYNNSGEFRQVGSSDSRMERTPSNAKAAAMFQWRVMLFIGWLCWTISNCLPHFSAFDGLNKVAPWKSMPTMSNASTWLQKLIGWLFYLDEYQLVLYHSIALEMLYNFAFELKENEWIV